MSEYESLAMDGVVGRYYVNVVVDERK